MFWPNTAEKFPSLRVTQFTGFWLRSWQLDTKPSRLLRAAAARELAPKARGGVAEKRSWTRSGLSTSKRRKKSGPRLPISGLQSFFC